jgi:murein DD-endopeptidase MepM/ murein hydrolase activator NlpD
MTKSLMKTPINGARLSSGFGYRKHPILGYNKLHKGVDFAAPSGTPIFAAGNGVVEFAGKNGAYGNYVRIRHDGTFKTAYAHMKGFKKGIYDGARVKQGDIIGYVGTTGRSTGPHLHYEIIQNGEQMNPAKLKLPSGRKLNEKELNQFNNLMLAMNQELDELSKKYAFNEN